MVDKKVWQEVLDQNIAPVLYSEDKSLGNFQLMNVPAFDSMISGHPIFMWAVEGLVESSKCEIHIPKLILSMQSKFA